jgi:hypothetical protein
MPMCLSRHLQLKDVTDDWLEVVLHQAIPQSSGVASIASAGLV